MALWCKLGIKWWYHEFSWHYITKSNMKLIACHVAMFITTLPNYFRPWLASHRHSCLFFIVSTLQGLHIDVLLTTWGYFLYFTLWKHDWLIGFSYQTSLFSKVTKMKYEYYPFDDKKAPSSLTLLKKSLKARIIQI